MVAGAAVTPIAARDRSQPWSRPPGTQIEAMAGEHCVTLAIIGVLGGRGRLRRFEGGTYVGSLAMRHAFARKPTRVTGTAANSARDLFEAGLNEAASVEHGLWVLDQHDDGAIISLGRTAARS